MKCKSVLRSFAVLMMLCIILSSCSKAPDESMISCLIGETSYSVDAEKETAITYDPEEGKLKVQVPSGEETKIDLSVLSGCADISLIEISSAATVSVIVPQLPELTVLRMNCAVGSFSYDAPNGSETVVFAKSLREYSSSACPGEIGFEREADITCLGSLSRISSLSVTGNTDVSVLRDTEIERLSVTGDTVMIGDLAEIRIGELHVHASEADLTGIDSTCIDTLQLDCDADLSHLAGTGIKGLILSERYLEDISSLLEMDELEYLGLCVSAPTLNGVYEFTDSSLLDEAGLSPEIDTAVLKKLIDSGVSLKIIVIWF